MDHQRPKVVPDRAVLVGPQVFLGKTGHKVVALGGLAHKVAGLDSAVLEAMQGLLGPHEKSEY